MLTELVPQFPEETGDAREDMRAMKAYLADWFRRLNEPDALAIGERETWTPTDASGAGLTLTVTSAYFVRIDDCVFLHADVTYPATASGATALIGGLPFTPNAVYAGSVGSNAATSPSVCNAFSSGVNFGTTAGANSTNANLSGAVVRIGVTYFL